MVSVPPPDPVDPAARVTYRGAGLDYLDERVSPLRVLQSWYTDALRDPRVGEPAAMVLATADVDGVPNARTVLLKSMTEDGFIFYTNTESTKAVEIAARPVAAIVLPWHQMFRQVRARGPVQPVSREQAEAYFQSRPRDSQVAAWASEQSRPLTRRQQLVTAFAQVEARFEDEDVLPLPPFWGGYLVRPLEVELWVGRESRLHDRWVWRSATGEPASLADASAWICTGRQP